VRKIPLQLIHVLVVQRRNVPIVSRGEILPQNCHPACLKTNFLIDGSKASEASSSTARISWVELPSGLGLKTSWNLLWTWGKPKVAKKIKQKPSRSKIIFVLFLVLVQIYVHLVVPRLLTALVAAVTQFSTLMGHK